MKRFWQSLGLMVLACGLGWGVLATTTTPMAQAAVKVQKLKAIPKVFRGTWHVTTKGKTTQLKITAKRFGTSKYRLQQPKDSMSAMSTQYFQPYRVKKAYKQALYLRNYTGVQTLRLTTIKHKKALIVYNEQEHSNELTVWTKDKRAKAQRTWGAVNPYGMFIDTRKDAKQNRQAYRQVNPFLKHYLKKALRKQTTKGQGSCKGINIVSYSAIPMMNKLK